MIRDIPELTPSIFSDGAAIAYIKTNATTKVALPYIKTYSYEYKTGEGKILTGYYTETIKCNFQVGNPSTVTFYIEASDLGREDETLVDRDFQIVLIGKPGA